MTENIGIVQAPLCGGELKDNTVHMAKWRDESLEIARSRTAMLAGFSLKEQAFADHNRDVDFLRSEVERLKTHVRSLSPSSESYQSALRNLLSVDRQWTAMSGVLAAMTAAGVRMNEEAKLAAKGEGELETPKIEAVSHVAGGVFRRRD
jgi:hypothetical protein